MPGKPLEIWYQDETRFGQKTKVSRVWTASNRRPIVDCQNGFKSGYIFGAVNPTNGKRCAFVTDSCNTDVMNIHLRLISDEVASDSQAVLIMDGAGWHRSGALVVPENISILHLPPYSPELNPVERLWAVIKARYLSNVRFDSVNNIIKSGCDAWRMLTSKEIMSICTASYLQGII